MSINFKFRNNENDEPANINLQFIPARAQTKLEEHTNIQRFFDTYSNTNRSVSQHSLTANSLRGYPIVGAEFEIPSTHVGFVFQEDKQPLSEDAPRTFHQQFVFNSFTYWNYDQNPSANDTLKKAVDGICMIEEIHKAVDITELEAFIKSQSTDSTKIQADVTAEKIV